jgi:hypothetical protein
MDNLPSPPDTIVGQIAGGIVFGIAVLGFIAVAVSRFFTKRSEAHPNDVRRSDTIELIDSAQIRNDLHLIGQRLSSIDGRLSSIDGKQDDTLSDLSHLKNREEAARMARDEVARLLAEERNRQR